MAGGISRPWKPRLAGYACSQWPRQEGTSKLLCAPLGRSLRRVTPARRSDQRLCLNGTAYTDPDCYGGHARLATICQQTKQSNPNTICVDAGDEFLGTPWDFVFEGAQNARTLPLIPTDVMTLGNHEFDYGVEVLGNFVSNVSSSFPVIGACNMDLSAEPALQDVLKWTVVSLGTVRVGLLGYIAEDTGELSKVGRVTFQNPLEAVPACLEEFKRSTEGANVAIIGLVSHAGLAVDREMAKVVERLGVSFIVSAHSHTKMFPGLRSKCFSPLEASGDCENSDTSEFAYPDFAPDSNVPILQQFFASKYVGVTTLLFDDNGVFQRVESSNSIPLGLYYDDEGEHSVEDSQEVQDAIAEDLQAVEEFATAVIGRLPVALSNADARLEEIPLGNLICDGMLFGLEAQGFPRSVDTPLVCIMNGGGIRAGLPEGDVTYGDVITTLPFGNTIDVRELTGDMLINALEHGVSMADNTMSPAGRFSQVGGGLSFVYDVSRPPGERVTDAFVDCVPVDLMKTYQVVTNSFIAQGGDGYAVLAAANSLLLFGSSLADSVADYIIDLSAGGESFMTNALGVQGRVVEESSTVTPLCIDQVGIGLDTAPARAPSGPPSPAPAGDVGATPEPAPAPAPVAVTDPAPAPAPSGPPNPAPAADVRATPEPAPAPAPVAVTDPVPGPAPSGPPSPAPAGDVGATPEPAPVPAPMAVTDPVPAPNPGGPPSPAPAADVRATPDPSPSEDMGRPDGMDGDGLVPDSMGPENATNGLEQSPLESRPPADVDTPRESPDIVYTEADMDDVAIGYGDDTDGEHGYGYGSHL